MTWFKIDDKIHESVKFRGAGLFGRALWFMAGVKCASKNTDGVAEELVVKDAAYLAEVDDWLAAAEQLVKVGMWHDAKSIRKCDRCVEATGGGKLPAGAFYFHDWNDWQLSKASQSTDEAKRKETRKRRLHRNKGLVEQIRERDGTLCRYCGIRVDFEDHRSNVGGTYDHVNPDGPNTLDNCVVACRGCNIAKGNRTPAEAGMALLDPGTARPALSVAVSNPVGTDSNPGVGKASDPVGNGTNPVESKSNPDTDQVGTFTDPDPTSRAHTRDSGRVRTGSETEPTGSENGSERAEAGGGPGPGRDQAFDAHEEESA